MPIPDEKSYHVWQFIFVSYDFFSSCNLRVASIQHALSVIEAAVSCYVCDQITGKIIVGLWWELGRVKWVLFISLF